MFYEAPAAASGIQIIDIVCYCVFLFIYFKRSKNSLQKSLRLQLEDRHKTSTQQQQKVRRH